MSICKKLFKLNKKTRKKTKRLDEKKPLKLNEKTKKKLIICYFVYLFIKSEKSSKPN